MQGEGKRSFDALICFSQSCILASYLLYIKSHSLVKETQRVLIVVSCTSKKDLSFHLVN